MDLSRKLSILVISLCIIISFVIQTSASHDPSSSSANCCLAVSSAEKNFLEVLATQSENSSLRYDFYHESCPLAEQIIRSTVHDEYAKNPLMVPAILRLEFNNCFVQGCDASTLLDAIEGMNSEKDIIPNCCLRGFTLIDTVKARLEETCPGVVSCADILVLAARESVAAAGGPFYPLLTGRRDSEHSFSDEANLLPGPDEHLVLDKFATKGFDEREKVSLLGDKHKDLSTCAGIHTIGSDVTRTRGRSDAFTDISDRTQEEKCENTPISKAVSAVSGASFVPGADDGRANGIIRHGDIVMGSMSTQEQHYLKTIMGQQTTSDAYHIAPHLNLVGAVVLMVMTLVFIMYLVCKQCYFNEDEVRRRRRDDDEERRRRDDEERRRRKEEEKKEKRKKRQEKRKRDKHAYIPGPR